ncbi:hypothetical protein KSP39_PZI012177 [Platanthera zijinensis]|uniref:Uncharacterized protein n=1 Tax=Platanthera zijinensis TaxID=2320716 RepID=A0AAP0BF42_9ASPA
MGGFHTYRRGCYNQDKLTSSMQAFGEELREIIQRENLEREKNRRGASSQAAATAAQRQRISPPQTAATEGSQRRQHQAPIQRDQELFVLSSTTVVFHRSNTGWASSRRPTIEAVQQRRRR